MSNQRQPNFDDAAVDTEEEGRPVENASLNTLMQVSEAEVNRQILTARAYPRNTTGFRQSLREMVCYDEETALSCLYALKRSGKAIQGPSIRFAEASFQTWGNARCGSRIVDIGEEFITAQGFFWDLEKNIGLAFEVLRRITNKEGERYGEDMIGVTGNAACSIALRNAILRGIPKTAWDPVYKACRQVSVGANKSISEQRDNMVKAFAPLNVDKAQILGLLGKKGMDDVTIDDMVLMAGILNSIKEGEAGVETVFALENMTNPGQVKPPQPKRSEFAREDRKETGKKTEPAHSKTESEKSAEEVKEDKADIRERERQDWIKDMYAELDLQSKVTAVADLMMRAIDAGAFMPDEQKAWEKACDDKNKAIMTAARAKR